MKKLSNLPPGYQQHLPLLLAVFIAAPVVCFQALRQDEIYVVWKKRE